MLSLWIQKTVFSAEKSSLKILSDEINILLLENFVVINVCLKIIETESRRIVLYAEKICLLYQLSITIDCENIVVENAIIQ